MVGPSPFDQVAQKAVGMPPEPTSTVKPSARSRSTYQAADLYSRQDGSWKSQIVMWSRDSAALFRAIQSRARVWSGPKAS